MLAILSFGSVVLFFAGLLVLSFRWFRGGSPEKLTNVSSSCDSDTPERDAKQEPASEKTNLGVQPNGGNSFGYKNEGAQGLQNNEREKNENLRHRFSTKKVHNGEDAEEKAQTGSTIESNTFDELRNSSLELEKENNKALANDSGETSLVYEAKDASQRSEVEIKTICKTNNAEIEISDKASEKLGRFETFESNHGNEDIVPLVEEEIVEDDVSDSSNVDDNTQEEANINKANDSLINESSSREPNVLQKIVKHDVIVENEVRVSEVVPSEAAVEVEEESGFEWREDALIKEQYNVAGVLSKDNLNSEVVVNDSVQPQGVETINNSVLENVQPINTSVSDNAEVENIAKWEADDPVQISVLAVEESNSIEEDIAEMEDENESANSVPSEDVEPVMDNVIEKFSDRLSKCIMDTVLQDTQLLYSQSEDGHDEMPSKESIMKFSDILAESIIMSVVDYSKVSQGHIAEQEEHDNLSPNVADVSNKSNENVNQEITYESSPPNEEDIFSADEANDDNCCKNLHEYAKRLSQQILSDVLDLHNQNEGSRSSTEVYVSKLTESVLSNAINGAKSCITDSPSLPDSDMGVESALDLFISEIVGNAVENALSRIASESHGNNEEQIVNQEDFGGEEELDMGECSKDYKEDFEGNHMDAVGIKNDSGERSMDQHDVEDQQKDMGEHSEGVEEHVGNHMDRGNLGANSGDIDTSSNDTDCKQSEASPENGANTQPIQQNGKLQSKWLSEDDLDELYDDDLSDEEDRPHEESSKSSRNSRDEKEPVTSPNSLKTPNNEKQFWRKSLIEDLDDDMDFDEMETPRSSISSSLTKSGNFDNFMVDGSDGSDDEVLEVSANVKVQAPVVTATDSSRSHLRSVDSTPVLILDNGSAYLKAGFSNQALPKEIVSSVVGTPLRYSQDISGMEYSARPGLVYGSNAMAKAGVLHIEYPLKSDLVEKWSDVEGMWNYVLSTLMCIQDNPDFPVLISQPGLNPKKNTEKIAEIMFEHFHMPSIFIADQLALSLFSMGYTSGLSFCSGFKSTQAGVVYEGHVLPHTVKQLDIAGYQLTENLKKLLMSLKGFGFRSSSQWQIVDDIKKKLGFVSLDFESDSKRYKSQAELQTAYELPDGQIIEVGLERFGCAESLFRPMELGLTQPPAHMLIVEAINSCEEELQELCYKAMGVSGGTTQMSGFLARLEQELHANDRKFKNFTAPEHRDVSTWLGGAVLASLPTFREMVVTVDEYAESGARVVHSKCF